MINIKTSWRASCTQSATCLLSSYDWSDVIELIIFLASKRPFSLILNTLSGCGLFLKSLTFYINIRITFILLVIFQDEHLVDWINFGLLDYPYIFFQKNHVKMYQIDASGFCGALFVYLSIIIVLHCVQSKLQSFDNKTKHLNIISLRHIGRYRMTTDIYMHFM